MNFMIQSKEKFTKVGRKYKVDKITRFQVIELMMLSCYEFKSIAKDEVRLTLYLFGKKSIYIHITRKECINSACEFLLFNYTATELKNELKIMRKEK